MMDTTCLYSTVRNISGTNLKFSFLPPHGRELGDGEEFTVFGNIIESVWRAGGRTSSKQHIDAFENAIKNRLMEIVHTPNPILFDVTDHEIKMLQLDNGTLGVVDPCWFSSDVSVSGRADFVG